MSAPATFKVVVVCSGPARGPESNPTSRRIGPAGWDWGTRTEAGQKVPQAKPERATPSDRASVPVSLMSAPGPSWPPGVVGVPRKHVLIKSPSPV